MLVLTRRECEAIMIGNKVEVKVLSIDDKQVKLGIEAPSVISVHRKEIYERIIAEKNI